MSYLRAFRKDTMDQFKIVKEYKEQYEWHKSMFGKNLNRNNRLQIRTELKARLGRESKKLYKLVFRDLENQLQREKANK